MIYYRVGYQICATFNIECPLIMMLSYYNNGRKQVDLKTRYIV